MQVASEEVESVLFSRPHVRRAEKERTYPEEFQSYEEAAEFWDTHDTTDYPDAFDTVEVEEAELRQRHYEVEIAPDLVEVLQQRPRKCGVSVSTLVSGMLRQQIRPAA